MPDNNITFTPNLALSKLPANYRVWAQIMNDNLTLLDAAVAGFVIYDNWRGAWTNSTHYAVGDTVVDLVTAVIWTAQVDHTSAQIPTTFLQDQIAHPTYWGPANAPATKRGVWLPNTQYNVNDFVLADGTKYAMCLVQHVSGTVFDDDAIAGKWTILIDFGVGTPIAVGSTPPLLPITNQLWWSSDLGQLFVWYNDSNSTQWVPASPSIVSSGNTRSYTSVGMDPNADDNSAALLYALQNKLVIDGGGELFRFTQALPTINYAYSATPYGDVGLVNMKMDFTAATQSTGLFYLRGAQSAVVGITGNVPIGRLTAFVQTAPVVDTSLFYAGAYVAIRSDDLFYPGGTGITRSEWNQVESVSAGVLTFRAPMKTQYTTNPVIYVLDNKTRPVFENVEIWANPAVNQKGIEMGFVVRPTWDNVIVHDAQTTGLSLALSVQFTGGSVIANNLVPFGNAYSMTIIGSQWGTIDSVQGIKAQSVLAIGATGGIISRDIVVSKVVGDGCLSTVFNTHPGTADITVTAVSGSSRSLTAGGVGDFCAIQGVNHTLGEVVCNGADRNGVYITYKGEKDIGRPTGHRLGFLRCGNVQEFGLQIGSSSSDPTSTLDYVHVGGIDSSSGRGVGIYADTSSLGDIYIGPSKSIQTSGPGPGFNEGAYHIRKRDNTVTMGTVTLDSPNAIVTFDYDQHAYWLLDTSNNNTGKVVMRSPKSQFGVDAVRCEGMSLSIEGEPNFVGYTTTRVNTFNNRAGGVNVQASKQQSGYKTAKWYRASESETADVVLATKDRLYMQPMQIRTPVTITALGVNVGATVGVGAQCQLAIYSNDYNNATAYAKLATTGVLSVVAPSVALTGALSAPITLPVGVYWIGSVHTWTGASAPSYWCLSTTAAAVEGDQFGSDTANQAISGVQFTQKNGVHTFGTTLPDIYNGSPYALYNRSLMPPVIVAGGSGYLVGDLITLAGGTSTTAAVLLVGAVSAGVITAVSISVAGSYTVTPANPVTQAAPPASGGVGATFNVLWVGTSAAASASVSAPAIAWQVA